MTAHHFKWILEKMAITGKVETEVKVLLKTGTEFIMLCLEAFLAWKKNRI